MVVEVVIGVRLRPGPEPAELELAAECMVVGSGDKVAEAELLVVERPVAAEQGLGRHRAAAAEVD